MSSKQNVFETLNKVDVSKYTEKKGKFNYLSWSYAVRELLKVCPTATWEIHTFKNIDGTDQPYMKNGTGAYVQVSVDVEGVVRTQIHPVLDHRNQTIKEPNAFEINTSIQRCLAKAIALHGLGLYIFAGEDLPEGDEVTKTEKDAAIKLASKIKDKGVRKEIVDGLNDGKVDSNNYGSVIRYIEKIIAKENE
jgi:hypothetical protein